MSPTRSFALPLVSAAALLAVLAGCDASSTGEGPGNGAGQPTSTGPNSSAAEPVPSETTGVPTPDAGAAAVLVGALGAVDPALVTTPTEAVANAVSLCVQLRQGDDPATAVAGTFPDVDLDAGQQQAVVTAVTSGFCPLDDAGSTSPSPSVSAS